jgi:anti-anti-sigma factor
MPTKKREPSVQPQAAFDRISFEDRELIRVTGEIDLFNGPLFRNAITEAVQAGRPVVIDMTACTYLDSYCVNTLLQIAERPNLSVRVIAASGSAAQRIFELTGISRVVPLTYVDAPTS